jgi:hypothetical protein
MWMFAIMVLCGAELNSEIEHRVAIDTGAAGRTPRERQMKEAPERSKLQPA